MPVRRVESQPVIVIRRRCLPRRRITKGDPSVACVAMASARRARLVPQLILLAVAVIVVGVGAVAWSRALNDAETDQITLDGSRAGELQTMTSAPDMGGEPFPDGELPNAEGKPVSLAADGTPMVVNFWFSSCPPCSRELPEFAEVAAEYEGRVRFVGVNPQDDAAKMTEFAAARHVQYELLMDPDGSFVTELGLTMFPTTLFVDGDGQIVGSAGPLDDDELRERLSELV